MRDGLLVLLVRWFLDLRITRLRPRPAGERIIMSR